MTLVEEISRETGVSEEKVLHVLRCLHLAFRDHPKITESAENAVASTMAQYGRMHPERGG